MVVGLLGFVGDLLWTCWDLRGISCGLVGVCGGSLAGLRGVLAGVPPRLRGASNSGGGLPPTLRVAQPLKGIGLGGKPEIV